MVYHLKLPTKLAIHDISHASLLKPHYGLVTFGPAPIIVADIDPAEYEVEALLYYHTQKYNFTIRLNI